MKRLFTFLYLTTIILIKIVTAFTPFHQRNQCYRRLWLDSQKKNPEHLQKTTALLNESFDKSNEMNEFEVKALLHTIERVARVQSFVDYLITEIMAMESMPDFTGQEPTYIEFKDSLVKARECESRIYKLLKPFIDRAMDPQLLVDNSRIN